MRGTRRTGCAGLPHVAVRCFENFLEIAWIYLGLGMRLGIECSTAFRHNGLAISVKDSVTRSPATMLNYQHLNF